MPARRALAVVLVSSVCVNAQSQVDGSGETREAGHLVIRPAVYERLTQAQICAAAEDFVCARERLQEASSLKLNDYERGQFWSFLGFIELQEGNLAQATAIYENVLRMHAIPRGMRREALYTTAQLYESADQHRMALDALEEWFSLTPDPGAQAHYLRAVLEYRLDRFDAAVRSMEAALAKAQEPDESWYQLLLALYHETNRQDEMIETLELLNSAWPTPERLTQLAELRSRRRQQD